MAEADKTAEEQVNSTETVTEAVAETTDATVVDAKKEETVGEALSKPESVPLSVFLELKKDNKELAKQMKDLQKSIETGATKKEVSADLKALADEHNVDIDFLEKLVDTLGAKAEEKISSKLKPLEDKERKIKSDSIFEDKFGKAIEAMPEYKDIVSKDVIKSLSLDPANQNKTWRQIIEGAYGHLITGRKTLESSTARGGKEDSQEVDFAKAAKDTKYFSEIMANPELKKKYNTGLAERLRL